MLLSKCLFLYHDGSSSEEEPAGVENKDQGNITRFLRAEAVKST